MLKRIEPFVLSKEDEDERALSEWIWQSHYWIETMSGIFECKWCHKNHNTSMGISTRASLCMGNPSVVKFYKDSRQLKFEFKQGGSENERLEHKTE